MSNYFEYNDKIVFHPGYYIKEVVKESGLTQEDFAKRLNTTPKNLSILIRGEQSLSIDIASKLSRMLGTSIDMWLNMQQQYDSVVAEVLSDQEMEKERKVFELMDYKYFKEHFGFDDLPGNIDEQIKRVREFLEVASLCVLKEKDLTVSFRSYAGQLSKANIINANTMVQIAINEVLKTTAPRFNKKRFESAVEYVLTQTSNHSTFLELAQDSFLEAGVVLIVLPSLNVSGIVGATKKVDGKMLLMVSDREEKDDTFLFTLFHEIGHIIYGDYGVTFKENENEGENLANAYARSKLGSRR